MEEKKFRVVVGIDFGSSGSGFAYSFNNENKIIQGIIKGANVNNKVPTEIILDKNENVIEFGAGCSKYLKKKKNEEIHYFKNIKMNLYKHNKQWINANNSGKQMELYVIIQKFLEKIKSIAIEQVESGGITMKEGEIKWVVTVPAIWEENAKSIMMKACIGAGLVSKDTDKSLFFALEPEAASIYCSRNKEIDQKYFQKGKYYILCDLGGGTGDIVTHLVGENLKLEEIDSAQGGNYGSNEINKLLLRDVIYKIFGYENFNAFYDNYKKKQEKEGKEGESKGNLFSLWDELERQINCLKEDTNEKNVEENDSYPLNLSIFKDIYGEDKNIEDLISRYNDQCFDDDLKLNVSSTKKWIVDFPYKIIHKYIQEQANSICKDIKGILLTTKKDIDTIIFVGGYCDNEILISSIKSNLPEIKNFLKPSEPYLAIMQGAVLFGIKSDIINIRKAKYTIGVSVAEIWNEKLHAKKGIKYYDIEDQVYRCKNCFEKYIEIGQNLIFGQKIEKSFKMLGSRRVNLGIYKSKKLNPLFIDEEGVELMGKYNLDTGKEYGLDERELIESMKFGGTFMDYEATHVKSGEKIQKILEFND